MGSEVATTVERSLPEAEIFTQGPLYWAESRFGSTGQRNTLVEHFCWGTEGQCLSRPLVELQSGPVQVCLRVSGQVGAFREILVQETVRVLVGSALPRALRVAEVDL
jgi:hypothetical protein